MQVEQLTPTLAQTLHAQFYGQLIQSEKPISPEQWAVLQALHGFAFRAYWHTQPETTPLFDELDGVNYRANHTNHYNYLFESNYEPLVKWLQTQEVAKLERLPGLVF
jgi:hypothetical protein